MKSRQRNVLNGVVRALCALSLILISFAHSPASAFDAEAVATAYVFPDGSVAVNCLTGQDDGNGSAGTATCEFCRIAGAIASPMPPDTFESCAVSVRADYPLPDDDEVIRQAFSANAPPRGPPFLHA